MNEQGTCAVCHGTAFLRAVRSDIGATLEYECLKESCRTVTFTPLKQGHRLYLDDIVVSTRDSRAAIIGEIVDAVVEKVVERLNLAWPERESS